MKIYTRSGDRCRTTLIGGERVPKYEERVEAYGSVDELTAHISMLRDLMSPIPETESDRRNLDRIMRTLMNVEALLALGKNGGDKVEDLGAEVIAQLERDIDAINDALKPIRAFTLPGGHIAISQANICRTVCRRAEREACKAFANHELSHNAIIYLNRLSDYLYVLGRRLTDILNVEEVLWQP